MLYSHMAKRTGSANLPLHGGHVPAWLSTRMAALGRVIVEAIVHEYGQSLVQFVQKLCALRAKYPILRRNRFLTGNVDPAC